MYRISCKQLLCDQESDYILDTVVFVNFENCLTFKFQNQTFENLNGNFNSNTCRRHCILVNLNMH